MNLKWLSVVLIIILAGTLTFIVFGQDEQVEPQQFFSKFYSSNKSIIVVDISNAPSPKFKQNVLQCGTDFIYSSGPLVASGQLSYYIVENGECTPTDFSLPEEQWNTQHLTDKQCYDEYSNYPYILLLPGVGEPEFYLDHAIIYIDENYNLYDCKLAIE